MSAEPAMNAADPYPIDPTAGPRWAIAVMTAGHYELDEFKDLAINVPAGGVSALVAVALSAIEMIGIHNGLTPEQALHGFALNVNADAKVD